MGGSRWVKSLKLADRLPTIPTGNGRRVVIVRAVAYLLPCCLPDFSETIKP
jgi:hypothetical protein